MIITYLRSSSYSCFDMCPQQYFLQYGLGNRGESNKKSDLGNVVHKALELLARKKLASQNNEAVFREDELGLECDTATFGPEDAIDAGYKHYSTKQTHHVGKNAWCEADFIKCRQWMYDCMEMNGGIWNPLTRKIVQPEQYFDIVIDKPWAHYDFVAPHGERVAGQLAIKGTVDLIIEEAPGILSYCDWKTGRRWDWAHDKVKTWESLRNDPQLRIYYYALSHLYPDIESIIMNIIYIQDGEVEPGVPNRMALSMPYSSADLPKTEEMLRRRFEAIKDVTRPKLNKSWKCKAFCFFGRNKQPGSNKTICEFFADEVQSKGMDKVIKQYGAEGAHSAYGAGGGSSNRDKEKE